MAHFSKAPNFGPTGNFFEINFVTIISIILVIITILSAVYLAHANSVATKGYALKSLNHERSSLVKDYGVWNMRTSEIKSLDYLKTKSKKLGLTTIIEEKFIRGDMVIAKK